MKFNAKLIISLAAVLFASAASAAPVDLSNCTEITQTTRTQSGRFIYKPLASHFNQGVVVTPRYYYPEPPIVEILDDATDNLIGRAKLKSDGRCAGWPECLFAAAYLTPRNGSFYRRHYSAIKIKVSPRTGTKACTYYRVPRPDQRAEYVNPASLF